MPTTRITNEIVINNTNDHNINKEIGPEGFLDQIVESL